MIFPARSLALILSLTLMGVVGCKASSASKEATENFSDPKAAAVADAVLADDGAKVTSLVGAGADANASGKAGRSLLEFSCWKSKHAAFDALLAAGADPSHADASGDTVMHYAAKSPDPQYLNDLLAKKVDPNMPNTMTGTTPLMETALVNGGPQMHALIAAHAKLDATRSNGETALIVAAEARAYPRVLDLLQAGADPKARDAHGISFQKYLFMTPEDVRSADTKAALAQITAWLAAHQIPIES